MGEIRRITSSGKSWSSALCSAIPLLMRKEILILISKLRSITKEFRICAIIDQDDDPLRITESISTLKGKIEEGIRNILSNRFPNPTFRPRYKISLDARHYSIEMKMYYRRGVLDIVLFVISGSLEWQISRVIDKEENSITCKDVIEANLDHCDWFIKLKSLLIKYFSV